MDPLSFNPRVPDRSSTVGAALEALFVLAATCVGLGVAVDWDDLTPGNHVATVIAVVNPDLELVAQDVSGFRQC